MENKSFFGCTHCKQCGRPNCDNNCKKTTPEPNHKINKRDISKDKTPCRIWPTDQEKNKGPKY